MLGSQARIGLAGLVLAGGIVLAAGPGTWAQTLDTRAEPSRPKPLPGYEWRPAPSAVHGFWGQRRWQRYSDDIAERGASSSSYGDVRR